MTTRFTSSSIRVILLALLVAGMAPVGASARTEYGPIVDANVPPTCDPPQPYDALKAGGVLNECTLCHDSDFGNNVFPNGDNARSAAAAAYFGGNYGFFCAANQAPVIDPAIGAKMVTAGQQLSISLAATDADAADILAWAVQNAPVDSNLANGANGMATFTWTPNAGDVGGHDVTFIVTDDDASPASAMEIVVITVVAANGAPVLTAIGNQSVSEGQPLAFTVMANDPDMDAVTLAASNLPNGSTFTPGTGAFSWTPGFGEAGTYSVTFTATDVGVPPLMDSETIMITVGDVNRPPVLAPIGNQGIGEGETLTLNLTSSDPDGDGLALTANGVPAGATFTPNAGNGTFSWTPPFGQTGNFDVTFTVTDDGSPNATDFETITISVGDVNRAPMLGAIGNRMVDEGQTLTIAVTSTDPDGDMVAIQAANLPTGATFVAGAMGTGTFSWTPTYAQQGNHAVTFMATDNGNPVLNATEMITITVGDVNRPPVLAPIGARSVDEGQLLQVSVAATDADGDALTLQLANQPQGAMLQDNGDGTGTLAWMPGFGESGNYMLTVSATDDGTPVAMAQETFTITVGDVNRPPVLATIGNKAANTNQLLTFTVSATDPDGDTLGCDLQGMPPAATFVDNQDGTGTFTWTPTDQDVGSHMMTFSAMDTGNPALSDSEQVTVAVGLVNNAPTLVQVGDRTVLQGQMLSFSVQATDPDGNALSFSASNAPAGATLTDNQNGTATFAWTPAADQVGSAYVTFMVTDDGIPPMSDEETVKLAIEGNGGGGFGVSEATWWDTWDGHLMLRGSGATPNAQVDILDADSGMVIGEVVADAMGDFETGRCETIKRKKRGKKRLIHVRKCLLPLKPPCEVQVREGMTLSLRASVANAPQSCGMGGPDLIDANAYYSSSKPKKGKKKRSTRRLDVSGGHAPAMSEVEIRDATTDVVLHTTMSDGNGRFSLAAMNPTEVPCFLRVASKDHFSEEIPVLVRKSRKGKKKGPWLPRCTEPASFMPPAPTSIGGGNNNGGGELGGGSNNGGGGNDGGGSNNGGGGNDGGGTNNGGGTDSGGGDPQRQAHMDAFADTVYPILRNNTCLGCHTGAPGSLGSPDIAHPDPAMAFSEVYDTQKVLLNQPYASRLVQRLVADGHFCWTSDCANDGETMRAAIAMWGVLVGEDGGGSSQETIASASLTMADGIEGAGNVRYDDAVIARWEFDEGAGNMAMDTSGVMPAMNLTLSGTSWTDGALVNVSGKAQAGPLTAQKLYALIADQNTGSNEYSIEAWVKADNLEQRGPSRIVSYSQDTALRNFTMGQENYNYNFRNRSRGNVSLNGTPALQTRDDDRRLTTELQHVVMTYDAETGRKIYVDGEYTEDAEPRAPGDLDNWNPGYSFIIGNERTDNRLWKGEIHFAAIHKRALSPAEIRSHALAGTESSLLLRFDVAEWTGQTGSVIEMTVREFDAYSYLLSRPTYVGPTGAGIPIRNLRLMVNGMVPVAGQAFRNLDLVVSESPQQLSPLASVIPKDQGPENDVFALVFEVLGDNRAVVVDNDAPVAPGSFVAEASPDTGLRNFSQINETMAVLTGVDPQYGEVERTFKALTQQLPGGNDIRGFVSSHQVGAFKLAVAYCNRMIELGSYREAIFGPQAAFNFSTNTQHAFQDPTKKALISDKLVDRFYGTGLANQPTKEQVRPVITQLLTGLTAQCTSAEACDRSHTKNVVKAACTAVLSSAPVLFH